MRTRHKPHGPITYEIVKGAGGDWVEGIVVVIIAAAIVVGMGWALS